MKGKEQKEKEMKRLLFLFVMILVLFTACDPNIDQDIDEVGSLLITLDSDLDFGNDPFSENIYEPTIVMEVSGYDIYGIGPDSETFSIPNVTNSIIIQNDILVGNWTVTVTAKNPSGTEIAIDTKTITITDGNTESIDIVAIPLSGQGAFSIDISMFMDGADYTTTDPIVNIATVTPYGGSSSDLPVSANKIPIPETGDFEVSVIYSTTLDTGYYTFSINLLNGESGWLSIGGRCRIIKNETTEYVYTYDYR